MPIVVNEVVSVELKNKIKVCFFDCFNVKSGNEERLKEKVAKLRYYLAFASMFSRGSAAIAEWIEEGIYQFHGYEFDYKYASIDCEERPSADLDAFCSLTLTESVKDYISKVHLSSSSSLKSGKLLGVYELNDNYFAVPED